MRGQLIEAGNRPVFTEQPRQSASRFRSSGELSIWASAAHGLVMIIATPIQKGPLMMVIESLPFLVIATVLWPLRPHRVRRKLAEAG